MGERDKRQASEQSTQLISKHPGLDPRTLSPVPLSATLRHMLKITVTVCIYMCTSHGRI